MPEGLIPRGQSGRDVRIQSVNSFRSCLYSLNGLSDRRSPCCPAGCVGGSSAVKVSGGRWSHKLTTSSGILGGAGVVGNPDTTCHDWAIGSIGGGAACERSVLIGLAGGVVGA